MHAPAGIWTGPSSIDPVDERTMRRGHALVRRCYDTQSRTIEQPADVDQPIRERAHDEEGGRRRVDLRTSVVVSSVGTERTVDDKREGIPGEAVAVGRLGAVVGQARVGAQV